MTIKEIAKALRDRALSVCGRGRFGLVYLIDHPTTFDSKRLLRVRQWFNSLATDDRRIAIELMDQCADECIFAIASLLDGAASISDNSFFELIFVEGGSRLLVSTGETTAKLEGDALHDIIADIQKADDA